MILYYTAVCMRFEMSGKLIVEADDLEKAFLKIAEHFSLLGNGKPSSIPQGGTDIKVKPTNLKTPVPPKKR